MTGATLAILTGWVLVLAVALSYRRTNGRFGVPVTVGLVAITVAGVAQLATIWGWTAVQFPPISLGDTWLREPALWLIRLTL